jgi:hypothetical protein
MSNLPPDWRPEPREHDERCPYMCPHLRLNITDEERFFGCSDHEDHWCTCDALHEQDAEREAEAYDREL